MIEGVRIDPLKVITDERGQLRHMLRADEDVFTRFGEIYFSGVNPGVVKGWKKHLRMTQHFAVPRGEIRLVIYDDRVGSPTMGQLQQIEFGEMKYQRVRIPALVWYSFGCLSDEPALIANCTDLPHDPGEAIVLALDDRQIPYQWDGWRKTS